MREVRVSPDGNAVAIRSDTAEDAFNAWFVGNGANVTSPAAGGRWTNAKYVEGWDVLQGGGS